MPLPKPSIPVGFLTSQNDQQVQHQPYAFTFSQPVEREPKVIVAQKDISEEKEPNHENGVRFFILRLLFLALKKEATCV